MLMGWASGTISDNATKLSTETYRPRDFLATAQCTGPFRRRVFPAISHKAAKFCHMRQLGVCADRGQLALKNSASNGMLPLNVREGQTVGHGLRS